MINMQLTLDGVTHETYEVKKEDIPDTRIKTCQLCSLRNTPHYTRFCGYCRTHIPYTHTFRIKEEVPQ